MSFASLCIAVVITGALFPAYNQMTGKEMAFSNLFQWPVLISLVIMVFLTGIIAGSFPAFILSAFRPIVVLKGRFSRLSKNAGLRKLLVIVQFAISVFLIVCTATIMNQLYFMKNKDLGFEKEHIIIVPAGSQQIAESYESVKYEFLKHPNVVSVSSSVQVPGGYVGDVMYQPEDKAPGETQRVNQYIVDSGTGCIQ